MTHPRTPYDYRRDRPFHIDFVFLPYALLEHVTAVRVGGYDDWIAPTATGWRHSDHAPVIVDFDRPDRS